MTSNTSLAAQAVADAQTAAPPSFEGHGWLVVVNLAIMTFAALFCGRQSLKLGYALALTRGARGPLVTLLRTIMLLALGGMTVRTGLEALTLWGWNPMEPVATGWYLLFKRLFDPFGGIAYIAAAGLFAATEDTLTTALERKPFPDRLVASLAKLKGSACFAAITLVACVLVVTFR